jgi:hypothetical protein
MLQMRLRLEGLRLAVGQLMVRFGHAASPCLLVSPVGVAPGAVFVLWPTPSSSPAPWRAGAGPRARGARRFQCGGGVTRRADGERQRFDAAEKCAVVRGMDRETTRAAARSEAPAECMGIRARCVAGWCPPTARARPRRQCRPCGSRRPAVGRDTPRRAPPATGQCTTRRPPRRCIRRKNRRDPRTWRLAPVGRSDDGSLRKRSIGAACSLAVCAACAPRHGRSLIRPGS